MISAVLNFLKPPGMTSHDAVSFVRHTYRQKRVGHSGTLDPAAAGVLPIYLGNATRLVEYGDSFAKTISRRSNAGNQTDTGDDTGTVLQQTTVSCRRCTGFVKSLNRFRAAMSRCRRCIRRLRLMAKSFMNWLGRENRAAASPPH